jgi:hypothetical protein
MRILCRLTTVMALSAALLAALAGCGDTQAPTYSGFLTATQFTPGLNRIPFVLADVNGVLLEDADVTVRIVRLLADGSEEQVAEARATWRRAEGGTPHPHPDGSLHTHFEVRGYYTADGVMLPTAGTYQAHLDAVNAQGRAVRVEPPAFRVDATTVPAIGAPAPPTANLTLADASFRDLSSRAVETDPLHGHSVAGALALGEPFVVAFASPAFCVSALCGPVVDEVAAAYEALGGRVPMLHIEPWVLSLAREEGRLVLAPWATEWGLPTEPWTFVVDGDGNVAARFEGLVNRGELLTALAALGAR